MATNIRETISNYFVSQPVTKAWIFGSYSRGEETPTSDIDTIVTLAPKEQVGLKFFQMREDLKALLGRETDLVTESSLLPFAKKVLNVTNNWFMREAIRDHGNSAPNRLTAI